MKVRELLSDESKWCKGDTYCNGPYCLMAAIYTCYSNSGAAREVSEKVRAVIGGSLIGWNDREDRTFAEVKALCEKLDI